MKSTRILFLMVLLVLAGGLGRAGAQTVTILHSFTGPGGVHPYAGLVQGITSNFFGTTDLGGTANKGTVYRIGPSGVTVTLHSFNGRDGAQPHAGLVLGSNSNFYGTTSLEGMDANGGTNAAGTVFTISPAGTLSTLTTLHIFSGADGSYPNAGLVLGRDGNFYGTTVDGGTANDGTVFKISPGGILTTLYSFDNGADGGNPFGGLVQGGDGNFYGTTYQGGTSANCNGGCGTVFKISPGGILTTLYNFGGGNGSYPYTGLVLGSDGNFYGTTSSGGASINCPIGCGTVFRISPAGILTTLYSFDNGADGSIPLAGLVQGSDGNFYGTTQAGTVFKISPAGALTTLYSSGSYIFSAGLVQGSDGNFYGTTVYGGTANDGTVFKLIPPVVTNSTVTGQISNGCDGSPIAGATVQIGILSATSGNTGSYTIRGLSTGTYFAVASMNNFVTVTNSITIPTASSVVTNNFSLHPTGATVQFIDPNPLLLDGVQNVVTDPDSLANRGTTATGAAADGVTPVLIRVAGNNASVTFSLTSGDPADGGLTVVGDTGPGDTSVDVPTVLSGGTNWAFAIYWAPLDFTSTFTTISSRTIQIQVSGSCGTNTVSFQLVRPPVVLVHGIWDKPITAWVQSGFSNYLGSAGLTIEMADYGPNNGAGFNPSLPFAQNILAQAVSVAIINAKQDLRTNNIAVTQVDVVGHSMGGLATRAYAQYQETTNPLNLMKGDIHKLITIGTPHYGSCLANFFTSVPPAVVLAFNLWGHPVDGAVNDLRVDSGALNLLGPTKFPGYAIAGYNGGLISPTEIALDAALATAAFPYHTSVQDLLGASNDTVVSVGSQYGGLIPDQNAELFAGVVHTAVIPSDVGETASTIIQERTLQLLQDPMDWDSFVPFPAPVSFFASKNYTPCALPGPIAFHVGGSRAATMNPMQQSSSAVSILAPTNGAVYNAGDTISLTAAVTNGLTITNVLFLVQGGAILSAAGPPFQTSFTLSSNIVGNVNIVALAVDSSGNYYSAVVTIYVQPATPLTSISIGPKSIRLSYNTEQQPLLITGNYGDGILRDITSGSAGTTYSTQSGSNAVVSVTTDGMLTAMGNGQDVIIVSNGTLSATVSVQVQISTATVCTYAIAPTNQVFSWTGGSNTVVVTATNGCLWTVSSGNSWITVTSGNIASNNGAATYSVSTNYSTGPRIGTTTIAGQLLIVNQNGAADSVGDGIPDWWRAEYFGSGGTNANSVSCALCDADGTGQNNLFKYIAGLDPTNPASVFVLQIAGQFGQPTWQNLLFNPEVAGRTYMPQFSTDLVSGIWSLLPSYSGPVTNGNQVAITDTNANPPREFYRIDISLP